MSDSQQHSAGDSTESKGSGANRRRVLQGIGAAGVATAVTGSASAQSDADQDDSEDVSAQDDHEIPISTQFWTYGFSLSTEELIAESGEAGYDAVEPYRVGIDSDGESISQALDDAGVELGSAHASLDNALNSPDETADFWSQFGSPSLIQAMEGEETWQTEDSVIEHAQTINEAADLMEERGLPGFGYHNHDHEFVQIEDGDEIAYDIFAQEVNDNVHLQIDAGWVLTGGEDPIHYITEYPEKVKSIHMKNMSDGEFTEIHEGDVNMRAVATAARNAADVDYLIYEYDGAPNPIESMNIASEWLSKMNHPYVPGGVCNIGDADTHPAKLY